MTLILRQVFPLLIIAISFAIFFALYRAGQRRSKTDNPGPLRKVWRGLVAVWDFVTNVG